MNTLTDLSENLIFTWENELKKDEKFTSTLQIIIDEQRKMIQNSIIKPKKYSFIEDTLKNIYLESNCKNPHNRLIETIYKANDMISWYPNPTFKDPEISIKNENYCANLVGQASNMQDNPYIFHNDKIIVGLFLMGKNQFYPAHNHPAWETWVILSGSAKWKVGDQNWESKSPGDRFTLTENEIHSIETLDEPLMCLWAWTGDLSSWARWVDSDGNS